MDKLQQRLAIWNDPPLRPAPPVNEIRKRARRIRRRRHASWAGSAVAAAAAIAMVVATLPTGSSSVQVDVAGPDGSSDTPATTTPTPGTFGLFTPPSSVEGGVAEVPVVFPDGTTATLTHPTAVGLHEMGVRPHLSVWLRPGDPRGTWAEATAYRGEPLAVVSELNGGREPTVAERFGDAVLYDTEADDILVFAAGRWTVVVPETRLEVDDLESVATHLRAHETEDGFLVFEIEEPLVHRTAELAFGPAVRGQVEVHASACTWVAQQPFEFGASETGWCQRDAQISFSVAGETDFVASVREGLEARDVQYPVSVIDPAWVDEETKDAWEAEHGPGTWIAVAFLPPNMAHAGEPPEIEDLAIRWRRGADGDLGWSREERLREALAALTGAPPPDLDTAWRSQLLDLQSASLRGDELVMDFDELGAVAGGSSAAVTMGVQFDATVQQYFPDANSFCVLVDGEATFWLHDMTTC